jgi:hypothetical protein
MFFLFNMARLALMTRSGYKQAVMLSIGREK